MNPNKNIITETLHLPTGDLTFNMMQVKKGTFLMGDSLEITIPTFYIAEFPATQALWEAVTGENPSEFKGKNRPVENVSWNDINGVEEGGALDFLNKLNKLTGKNYRLPSESEWEYAAIGGHFTTKNEKGIHRADVKYAGSNRLEEVGWYSENSYKETKEVGLKLPNQLGLYDMSGNVWEWCEDKWHGEFGTKPPKDTPINGKPWLNEGHYRVHRGGSYFSTSRFCRVALRSHWIPGYRDDNVGFRLALSLQSDG